MVGAGPGPAFGVAGLFAACGLAAALILLGSRRTATGSPHAPTPTRAAADPARGTSHLPRTVRR